MDIRKWRDRYSIDNKLKYPSERTQENYLSSVGSFLNFFESEIEPKSISNDKIKNWLLTFNTINTRNHKLCAIKSFYEITVGMPLKLDKIPFGKKDKKLPVILSIEEVQKLFSVCENLKHRVIIALLYSCGLRVSELLNLKWSNIDRSRMIINIIEGKGKKDRQVMLTPELIPLFTDYYKQYKSIEYILNGQFPEKELRYSSRSVLEVVKKLALKACLNKRVYTHLIRHCSFTHMVENGTDINLVQKLAGHSSVKTTNLYLHISHNHISKIQSPLSQIKM